MNREKIINDLIEPLLEECYSKSQQGRFQSPTNAKIRIGYINAFSRLLSVYATLLRDKELDEIQQEVEELKEMYNNGG